MEKLEKFTADEKLKLSNVDGAYILSQAENLGHSRYSKGSYWMVWRMLDRFYISLDNNFNSVWQVSEEDAKAYREYDIEGNILQPVEKTYSASEVKDMLKAYGEELEQLIRDGYNITDRDEHVADFITNYYK